MRRPSDGPELRRVYLDLTHLGRHVTGIERIAIELFEKADFEGADVRPVRASGPITMVVMQQIWLPLLALVNPHAAFVFPGFPPSPVFVLFKKRTVWYVHDLFLITRRRDLGLKAKLYMAWPFRFAVKRLKYFLVNSQKTASELQPFAPQDAAITLYRPRVANVFDLTSAGRDRRPANPQPLKLVSLGTVEPRKNYAAAVQIRDHLEELGFPSAQLHIIGRAGWGEANQAVADRPHVTVHGYLDTDDAKRVLESCDIYLCTSHDEGLGLPLLEAQYAGLAVVAPDAPVFREVLGDSAQYFALGEPLAGAQKIAALVAAPRWRKETTEKAVSNPERWNANAVQDFCSIATIFRSSLSTTFAGASAGES